MTRMEYNAVQYAKIFAKDWDYFCIAVGAYMNGFRDAEAMFIHSDMKSEDEEKNDTKEHQLSASTFKKWQEQNEGLPFKEALKKYLPHYNFTDLRVHEYEGILSFQGMVRKK